MMTIQPENPHDKELRARLHSRIRRTKQFLRPLPRRANLHRWPIIKWFATAARRRPFLWKFGVREVSVAIYLGSIIAFLPIIGFQFIAAFFIALAARTNLLVIMSVQLVTNFATAIPIYLFTTRVGKLFVELAHLPAPPHGIVRGTYNATVGGLIVGLLFGLAIDVIFRLTLARRLNKQVNVKRMLKT